MCLLFNLSLDSRSKSIFNDLQSKAVKVYYFDTKDNEGVVSTDTSSLNVMDCDQVVIIQKLTPFNRFKFRI